MRLTWRLIRFLCLQALFTLVNNNTTYVKFFNSYIYHEYPINDLICTTLWNLKMWILWAWSNISKYRKRKTFDHNKWMSVLETNCILLLAASCFIRLPRCRLILSTPLAVIMAILTSHLCPVSHSSHYPQDPAKCLIHNKRLINIWRTEFNLKNMKLQVIQDRSKDA